MISEAPRELYVWVWLPGTLEPVVAGRLYRPSGRPGYLYFNYGNSYLGRSDAIPLYAPELPLQKGAIMPTEGLKMASSLRDGSPDAWGRRVIVHRLMGRDANGELDELAYMLESGSDRIGGIDFQRSATEYIPRGSDNPSLEELREASERVEKGLPLTPELDRALNHGSSIGGARPKALIQNGQTKYVAKFSSSSDHYNVVKGEYVAMRLAQIAGLNVAPVRLEQTSGHDVLLVERFDRTYRPPGFQRHLMVSALTLFGLDEMMARYAGYDQLTAIIRQRFSDPTDTLIELYKRLVFNILVGNTDDHARNHAAFWDGRNLRLTPAYDICPQNRSTGIASQAMRILGERSDSRISLCRKAAIKFNLSSGSENDIIESMRETIISAWDEVCDEARLTQTERKFFWGRQFLNPSIDE